jgi:large repetitive protein
VSATLTVTSFALPGSGQTLTIERDGESIVGIVGEGVRYLAVDPDGGRRVGGLAEIREVMVDGVARRTVTTPTGRWTEEYRWDAAGLLAHVDGVDVTRDDTGRITRCRSVERVDHDWHYAYVDGSVVRIGSAAWCRHLTWDPGHGRVVASRVDDRREQYRYDGAGRRTDVAELPRTHHRDGAGRLWVVTDGDGGVVHTYLWNRYMCFARIDGALGAPLAAAFLLDPSGTPVRVTTPLGTRRIPRDAFGEGLLAEAGVPGLFGGTIHRGLVHLPHRVLDPRLASFCSPDPHHGDVDDPRRADGFPGALPTEVDRGGPYCVSRNDPVGRTDPTGAFTGGGGLAALIISDLTWSLQNNLLTFFGIDWVFNFVMSLLTGFQLGDFGSTTGLGSSRVGSFGLRRDGFVAFITGGRAFTTQHLVWSPAEEFELLHEARVIDPGTEFEPTLYGGLLAGRPRSGEPFVLCGMANPGGVAGADRAKRWSRSGGPGVAATPGAVVPKFPRGGFHLDDTNPDPELDDPDPILGVRGPQPCRLAEADVGPAVGIGTLDPTSAAFAAALSGGAFSAGDLVLFADSDDDLVFATIDRGTPEQALISDDLTTIGPNGITVVRIDPAPLSSESRNAEPAVANAFTAIGSTVGYARGNLLRVSASGGEVTAARVARTEARVPLDRPVPAAVTAPFQVRSTVPGAAVAGVLTAASEVEFAGAAPTDQTALVTSGTNAVAVVVTGTPATNRLTVDADLTAVAAVGDNVQWVPLTSGAVIGSRVDAPEATAQLTFLTMTPGAAPDGSAGGVVLRFDGGGNVAVRSVTGPPNYDAVVADRPLAGAGPFQVERRRVAATPAEASVASLRPTVGLAVEPNEIVPDNDTGVLRIQVLDGEPPVAGPVLYAGASVSGETLTTTQSATAAPAEPRPGQVVILDPGGAHELVPVSAVRVTVELDRALDVAAEGITAVRLGPVGTAWTATRVGPRRLRVRPEAFQSATATVPVEFPRFRVGESVRVEWDTPPTVAQYRVGDVDGLTIDLESDGQVPAGATDIRVRRRVPVDPGTGTELIARDGEPDGAVPTNRIQWSVWRPDALAANTVIGVVTAAGTTIPAVVQDVTQDVAIILASAPAAGGPLDVAAPTVIRTRHSARYRADGEMWRFDDIDPADLVAAGPHTLLVTPFLDTDRAVEGTIGGGTLIVPEDEGAEVDRHQSLVDHELRHTQQYSWFGPLWFNIFPLWALELGVELGTGLDLPTYGPFTQATIAATDASGRWRCTLASAGAASGFSANDKVQVVRGGTFADTEVERVDGAVLVLKADDDSPLPIGATQVRRRNASTTWDVIFSILRATTHGGLLNLGFGNTWGRLLWLIMKGVYGLHRARVGPGDLHAATVEDRTRLRLTTEDGEVALRGATMVIVRNGDDSVVRSVTRDGGADTVLQLDERLPFDVGEVRVAPYGAHDPGSYFDWNDYFPARVPDPSNSARIEVLPIGTRTLTLEPNDRVEVQYRSFSFRAEVTSVSGATVELTQPIPDSTLRIAKVFAGQRDPMSSVDSSILVTAGLGWLRWVFDPYGQIQARVQPEKTFWDIVARTARYGLGTQSWSLLPAFGFVWYDRLFRESVSHRSFIEQDASEQSGDLYSALGRLYGQAADAEGFAHRSMTVGDVARYWYWPGDRHAMQVRTGNFGAPGVHLDAGDLRLLCNRDPADRNEPANSDTGVADGARTVPDVFGVKETPDPGVIPTGGTPDGVTPSATGLIPLSPTLQRAIGCYVAWTRPGEHRAVTSDGIRNGDPQDLHDRETRQTLFFDITVDDVTVTIGGQPVAEGATVPLVLTQSAPVVVTPDGDREYAVTTSEPTTGTVLQVGDGDRLVGQTTAGAGEVVEVSRVYRERDGGYSGGLDRFGIHLGGDVHVPVRQFIVDVVDSVPVRATADPGGAEAPLVQGTAGFVLVPAAIVDPLQVVTIDGHAPGATDPAVTVEQTAVEPDSAAGLFVGATGAVFSVVVAADPVLAATVPLVLDVRVGTPGGAVATLTCETTVAPA